MAFWQRRTGLVLTPADHPVGTRVLIATNAYGDDRPIDRPITEWAPSGEWVRITDAGWIRPYHFGICEILPAVVS